MNTRVCFSVSVVRFITAEIAVVVCFFQALISFCKAVNLQNPFIIV